MGHDQEGRAVFVPQAIPGEKVLVTINEQRKNFARATLVELIEQSPDRVKPQCPHFGVCGGCHLQHVAYDAQLKAKREVVIDQLKRIGGLKDVEVMATASSPKRWNYRIDVSLSPTPDGRLGFWSPSLKRVIPIDVCHVIHPRLLELWQDFEIALPQLRKLTLRIGDDDALLAALEIDGVEPPELHVDFPVSVAIVLPDRTAASLVGDSFLVQSAKGRDFRVSPGCYFQPNPAAAELIIDQTVAYASLSGKETILEAYSGVGMLTAFVADGARDIICIEHNADAIADATANLQENDNIALYQGRVEEVAPLLQTAPDVAIVNPPSSGLTPDAVDTISAAAPERLIYVSSDVATFARDGKQLKQSGYRLAQVTPIDTSPQTYHIDTVSLFFRK